MHVFLMKKGVIYIKSIVVRTLLSGLTAGILLYIFDKIISGSDIVENIGLIIIVIFTVFIFSSKGEKGKQ